MPNIHRAAPLLVAGSTASGQVTLDRLRTADNEPENWLVYGGTYRSMRYSALDQIDTGNVHSLKAAWAFQAGELEWYFQTIPHDVWDFDSAYENILVDLPVDGKQYIATPSGWGSSLGAMLGLFYEELQGARQGATVFAFELP